ncbi:MAG: 16S rRNA (cytosine(967)-C(5))-methyltransferase RsmB [Oscillospiraceae bacterium]|jgi:16S rRNA (cytosine967-C5)-methyltransferase|nr:16S rRNA (cytosine(967)-C(5))-methyltransferase RsmB [Oscillospiraceae bacterium]
MTQSRKTVLELLCRMEQDGAYSNIILDNTFSRDNLSPRDKGFAAALFYGILERKMTLDFLIRQYSDIEFDKLSCETVQILRMGFYQLLYMDSVPENAAVNESANLADRSSKGFVNAILRNFIRDNLVIDTKHLIDEAKLSIDFSCPKWLIKKWTATFGEANTHEILKGTFGRPPIYLRVNTLKFQTPDVIAALTKEKFEVKKNVVLDDCIELERMNTSIELSDAYRKGMFHVQDISSQLCCKLARPGFNQTVIDLCAAPGGKSFTMAQMMNNRGLLISCDLYGGKLSLIENGAKRLGLDVIRAVENDAGVFNPSFPQADTVLCDVPCSGLGVIRRKPEIKYKPMKSLEGLPEVQRRILSTAAAYVKSNGTLIYSTCTLNPDENEAVVDNFQYNHPEFSPYFVPVGLGIPDASRYNLFPHVTGGDGFFIAIFRRKADGQQLTIR